MKLVGSESNFQPEFSLKLFQIFSQILRIFLYFSEFCNCSNVCHIQIFLTALLTDFKIISRWGIELTATRDI